MKTILIVLLNLLLLLIVVPAAFWIRAYLDGFEDPTGFTIGALTSPLGIASWIFIGVIAGLVGVLVHKRFPSKEVRIERELEKMGFGKKDFDLE